MNYPLISEYVSAILSAEDNFDQLNYLRPVLNEDGTPVMTSGNFAVVFKMKDSRNGRFHAVKCFIKEQKGRAEAYKLIAEELKDVPSYYGYNYNPNCLDAEIPPYFSPVKYLEGELFVNSAVTSEREFPILLMDWVEGVTLDHYVRSHIDDRYALQMLAYRFGKLAVWLLKKPFAHGDLKSDNIMVRSDGSLALVDYDGMYVQAMKGQRARELGSPNFRHPNRTENDFDEHLDDFSAISILLSLQAIAHNPYWLYLFGADDRLLLSEKDYRNVGESEVVRSIYFANDPVLHRLLVLFLLVQSGMSIPDNIEWSVVPIQPKYLGMANRDERVSTVATKEEKANGFVDACEVLYNNDGTRLSCSGYYYDLDQYFIRPGTKVVCDNSFYDFRNCNSIIIPDSVSHIGDRAFGNCESLCRIEIPHSVKHIGVNPFELCHRLSDVICESPFFVYENHLLFTKDKQTLIAGILPYDQWDGFYSDDLLKNLGFNVTHNVRNVHVPDGVTAIAERAFASCYGLLSITLSNDLIEIGDHAFLGCRNLRTISLPHSVSQIGAGAFFGCKSLHTITIPSSVKCIGVNPFESCINIEEVICLSLDYFVEQQMLLDQNRTRLISCWSKESNLKIPESVTEIGESAFSGCNQIESILLPNNLRFIGKSAFEGCSLLQEIIIPSGVSRIEDKTFRGCSSLRSLVVRGNVDVLGNSAFEFCENLESIDIKGVKHIEDYAFAYCRSLKVVSLPNNLTKIGENAFSECENVIKISLPDSLTYIGDYAFKGCKNLRHVDIPNGVAHVEAGAFWDCERIISLTIPKSVITFGGNFSEPGLSSLECINIQASSDEMIYCQEIPNLYSLVVAGGARKIGNCAICDCYKLKYLALPQSVEYVDEYALVNSFPSSIYIPLGSRKHFEDLLPYDTLVEVSPDVFSLIEILPTTVTKQDIDDGVKDEFGVVYSRNGKRLLKGNIQLKKYTVRPGTKVICDEAFSVPLGGAYSDRLQSVELPEGVVRIGEKAFSGCTQLSMVKIPQSVLIIDSGAFSGCVNITSIKLPSYLTHIEDSTFASCLSLQHIDIPDDVMTIGNNAFGNCRDLETITIPSKVNHIGNNPFADCRSLRTLYCLSSKFIVHKGMLFDEKQTKLICCFSQCNSVIIPEGVTHIAGAAFAGCSRMLSVALPDGLLAIEDFAFQDCRSLKSLTIPKQVTHIGNNPFLRCDHIQNLVSNSPNYIVESGKLFNEGKTTIISCFKRKEFEVVPQGVTHIGDYAFAEAALFKWDGVRLKSIELPTSWTHIGKAAFSQCNYLKSIVIPEGGTFEEKRDWFQALTNSDNVCMIGDLAFENCCMLKSIKIPENVKSIGNEVFRFCSDLSTVTLSQSVERIGFSIFDFICDKPQIIIPKGEREKFEQLLSEYKQYLIEN